MHVLHEPATRRALVLQLFLGDDVVKELPDRPEAEALQEAPGLWVARGQQESLGRRANHLQTQPVTRL